MLPLMAIGLPQNAGAFFKIVFEMAGFDFYDTGDIMHNGLDIEPTEAYLSDLPYANFEAIKFDSMYMINNMGTLIFVHAIYPLTIIFERALRYCKKCSKRIKRTQRNLNSSLYWSSLTTIIFESYAVVAICCLIGLKTIGFETRGMALQSVICIFYFIFMLTVPYAMICYVAYKFNGDDWSSI